MKENTFYYKKDLTSEEISLCLELSEDVVFFQKSTKFGKGVPHFFDFLNFLKIKYFTIGHYNFNSLNLDTQIPAIINYSTIDEINIKFDYWNKIYIRKELDPNYFEIFSSNIEFMIFDSLINYEIIGDGYYENKKDLIKRIIDLTLELKEKHNINSKLVFEKSLEVNKKLLLYKDFFK